MRQHTRGRKGPRFSDPEFVEALNQEPSNHSSSGRQAERKAQQFCRQVQRALNLALAGRVGTDNLFVEEVHPAPDCGHLLVHLAIPPGVSVADTLAALGRQAPALRSEVAAAISRKRAPELFFAPAY
ncbi:MAG: ribosome-binding factor A [Acidobacteria bacterium]|nr:ribosome-binding factor A [Acidobacteriota bacterium]